MGMIIMGDKGIKSTKITKKQAQEFYRDLCGTYNGNSNKNCQGVASIDHIAETMQIDTWKATLFCDALIQYGITERQDGKIVI